MARNVGACSGETARDEVIDSDAVEVILNDRQADVVGDWRIRKHVKESDGFRLEAVAAPKRAAVDLCGRSLDCFSHYERSEPSVPIA